MAHPIENTLALLQDAMIAHRNTLAGAPSVASSSGFSLPRARRGQLVTRLLAGVEKRAGIEVAQPAAEKLLRVLASVDIVDLEAWVARLDTLPAGDAEWLSLIESLTVHETYVMRDPSQLEFFAAQLPALIAESMASKSHLLRFWSLGCATGEEAYSIAALTLDAMVASGNAIATVTGTCILPPWRIEVVGSDISRLVLTQARAGVYDTGPLSSFRDEFAPLLHHFPSALIVGSNGTLARVASADLKALVRFEHFNIMDDPMPTQPFDAVFCRNVLVYFSARARRRAQESLRRAVRTGGYLLLGPTDTLIDTEAFEALWAPDAVIYRRRKDDA
jgi:chemotaxis protein methyltransferase CheR